MYTSNVVLIALVLVLKYRSLMKLFGSWHSFSLLLHFVHPFKNIHLKFACILFRNFKNFWIQPCSFSSEVININKSLSMSRCNTCKKHGEYVCSIYVKYVYTDLKSLWTSYANIYRVVSIANNTFLTRTSKSQSLRNLFIEIHVLLLSLSVIFIFLLRLHLQLTMSICISWWIRHKLCRVIFAWKHIFSITANFNRFNHCF